WDRILRHQKVEGGGDELAGDTHHRHSPPDRRATLRLADVEAGKIHLDTLRGAVVDGQLRVDALQVEIPLALASLRVARGEGAVGEGRLTGRRVQQHRLMLGGVLVTTDVRSG